MASKCSFRVPDSNFHVPACAPFAPRQQERTLPPPSSDASCRSFCQGERLSEFPDSRNLRRSWEPTWQDEHQTKLSNQTVDDLFWFISFRRSAVQFPASSFRRREPDRRGISSFQIPASICAWPFWGWGEFPISGFRLPALARWM